MSETDLKTRIVEILTEKKIKSGGHNGTYLVEIRDKTGAEIAEIKTVLNELYREKKIRKAQGSRGVLVLLKK